MSHLAILGASGHGKVIADTASLDSHWKSISFFDDSYPNSPNVPPWDIIGNTASLLDKLDQFSGVIIGIGNNTIRQQKHELLASRHAPITKIIHPSAYISPYSKLSEGCVVFANAVINIHTTIGCSSIINTGATIDHDCKLADYTHISPGSHLAGNIQVGKYSWIGIGSSIRQGINIGENVIIGAGSTVVKNIPDHQVVAGTPAKLLTQKDYA